MTNEQRILSIVSQQRNQLADAVAALVAERDEIAAQANDLASQIDTLKARLAAGDIPTGPSS